MNKIFLFLLLTLLCAFILRITIFKQYDYIIVGSGIYGATFAHELKKAGKSVLVLEKRDHIAGNIYTKKEDNINIHVYGPHIFHTSDEEVWSFLNQFVKFNNYINNALAYYKGKYYHLPFNMNTFKEMWGVTKPEEAKKIIEEQIKKENIKNPKNLEEQALSLVGRDIYEKLIKGYTEKQWGRKATELPAFIIKRLPLRFEYNNNYFNDKYQGIPIGGYTLLIQNMLKDIKVKLNTDYLKYKFYYNLIGKKIVFTGPIDEFFNYKFGPLEYRSLKFEIEKHNKPYYQNNCIINYNEFEIPYTRIIEHKYFEDDKSDVTFITKEYPDNWELGKERYYPINNEKNNNLYNKYKNLAKENKNFIFGGRLANYKYYDMDDTVRAALDDVKLELQGKYELK
jgi:UDP-galactopyranose mutase